MIYTIYTLNHPVTLLPFYVGMTSQKLTIRLQGHLTAFKRENMPVYKYMRTFKSNPTIKEISVWYDEETALKEELHLIEQLTEKGHILYNRECKNSIEGDDVLELFRAVRLPKDIVDLVEENKKKTGIPISVFFTMAAEKKLKELQND